MKEYPNYTDVSSRWVKRIPNHWSFLRLRQILQERKERNSPIKTTFILSLTASQGVVPVAEKEGAGGNKPKEDMSLYNIAHANDLLVNCMNVVAGSAGVSRWNGAISPVYYALYPRDGHRHNIWFFHYIFRLFTFQRSLIGLGKGIMMKESSTGKLNTVRMRISMGSLNTVPFPVPPRDEQDQIVRYLDWKVSKIDKLIATKKQLIERYEEYGKALVNRVVTRGLRPDVAKKPSGINWLGEIPAHWDTRRAKYMYKKENRQVSPTDEVVTCFRDGEVTLRKNRRTSGFTESLKEIGYQGIRSGDLVIHVMDAFAGAIGVSDSDGKGTPVYSVCTAIGDYNNHYYAYVLREMARCGFIQSLYKGIRERSSDFRFEVFAQQWLPIPPRTEQDEIVAYLSRKSQKLKELKVKVTKEIQLLEELKQRLISDVVTGQMDVRDVNVPEND